MTERARSLTVLLIVVALVLVGGFTLLRAGIYGWTLFALLPLLVGALCSRIFRPTTAARAAGVGALATALPILFLLLLGLEGLACIAMALPMVVPFGALGGLLTYYAWPPLRGTRGLTISLLLPLVTFAWDTHAKPPVFTVQTAITVKASPEQVWQQVVAFSQIPPPHEWFFRAGVAYPERARIEGSGPGAVRYCEFSTGAFVEPIEVWDEPHLLRFGVTDNPAPLQEWSPYGRIQPKHLHGYLISKQGEFRLSPLANGETLLQGTTWYQHGLWPAEYWRWWSDAIIHRIHLRVLSHVRALAERQADAVHTHTNNSNPGSQ